MTAVWEADGIMRVVDIHGFGSLYQAYGKNCNTVFTTMEPTCSRVWFVSRHGSQPVCIACIAA